MGGANDPLDSSLLRAYRFAQPTMSKTVHSMNTGNYVAYYRVSTDRQGRSGLGLEGQRQAVDTFLNGGDWKIVREYTEVESGKSDDNRPQLAEAIKACRVYGAKLVIAKLDRLSRDAHFLLALEKAGVDFVCADMPNANRLTVGIMAMVAEEERRMISTRTKAALAAAKARGTKLGGFRGVRFSPEAQKAGLATRQAAATTRARELAPLLDELRAAGVDSLNRIARALTEREIPTPRGSTTWSPSQVARLLNGARGHG
jgi:DNA invertase Pin-like site-specific DNA recombinase